MQFNKILLIATRQIGDVLLTTPLLRSLRRAYPAATLDVLIYKNCEGILEGNPAVNALIPISEYPSLREYFALGQKIFRRYELAISTLAGDRPILYALSAAPLRAAIVPPKSWQSAWKRQFVQNWVELDNWETHTVVQNLRLADALGIPRCYEIGLPQLPDTEDFLDKKVPFAWRTQAFAVLHLFPKWRYKQWTRHGWAQLIGYLLQKPLRIVLTGSSDPDELSYIQSVINIVRPPLVNLAGQLRFSEVARLIQASVLYVGPDTAVTHLAAATGTPTVALYGPTNPLKWAPWPCGYAQEKPPFAKVGSQQNGNVLLIQGVGDCVPCHQEGCDRHRQSHSMCLETLTGATVIQAIDKWIIKSDAR